MKNKFESIVLGGGCFWCLDAVFSRVKGVESVVSGYAGGAIDNPTYGQVSMGNTSHALNQNGTGHAETVKIEYDPEVINYAEILNIFFSVHDPTTLNRQGQDIGPQYRSIILYDTETQKERAEKIIKKIDKEKVYTNSIVTEIKPLTKFYPAEDYHQKYFEKNPDKAYCQIVISPKIAKLRQKLRKYYKGLSS